MRGFAVLAAWCVATAGWAQFDAQVAPLLLEHCVDCHSGLKPKGDLDLTRKAATFASGAVVPGSAAKSPLWIRVRDGEMPPKKPLGDREKATLKAWIDAGAGWGTDPLDPFRSSTSKRAGQDWWSLQPLRAPAPPPGKTPIDGFVDAALAKAGLTASPEADRRTLLRRLAFDLVGLPPTPEEVDAFERDRDPNAYAKQVDRLLALRHYGERWARHWLDVVRFGESHGFEHDEIRPHAWPYRDWVIRALNEDLPFDRFAKLQIAGDVMPGGDATATGFLVAGGYDSVGQKQQSSAMRAVVRQDELEDVLATVGQTFLGFTVQCARCHDHKFDPVRQEEYYRMQAALAGVRHGTRDVSSAEARARAEQVLAEQGRARQKLEAELDALEAPARTTILAERKLAPPALPRPRAQWDFRRSLAEETSGVEAKLFGQAKRTSDGLVLSGTGDYASFALVSGLGAKTLSATVKLGTLDQRGGAALSVQTPNGQTFDAIVFGEKSPRTWLAGSDFFRRTRDFGGPPETARPDVPVHVALVYRDDGTIAAFRDGQPYGKAYAAPPLVKFEPGQTQVLFGLRHSPAGNGKHFVGTIVAAAVHDRALDAGETAALATGRNTYVSDADLDARLSGEAKARRAQLRTQIADTRTPPPTAEKRLAYVVVPQPPDATHLLYRGEPHRKGPIAPPGGVAALGAGDFGLRPDASDAERRIALADWIASPKNPLFARVVVNRLWHHHFGVGIVDTPSDFGFSGGRPTHPELLDWLASELIRSGWSLKAVHRAIVTSEAYRRASLPRAEALARDAQNRLLWRKSPTRLDAEALRDATLAVAGQLDATAGGPGFRDFRIEVRGATHYYHPIDDDLPALRRRSVYRTWARGGRSTLLDALDCPDPSVAAPRRAVTTTPLQALALLNGPFALRLADRLAERAGREAGPELPAQVARAYRLAYGRVPSADELRGAVDVAVRLGLPAVCRAILNSNEFLFVD